MTPLLFWTFCLDDSAKVEHVAERPVSDRILTFNCLGGRHLTARMVRVHRTSLDDQECTRSISIGGGGSALPESTTFIPRSEDDTPSYSSQHRPLSRFRSLLLPQPIPMRFRNRPSLLQSKRARARTTPHPITPAPSIKDTRAVWTQSRILLYQHL